MNNLALYMSCGSICTRGKQRFYRAACKTKESSVQIFLPYERPFSLVFWEE